MALPFRALAPKARAEVKRIVATLLPPQPRLALQRGETGEGTGWPRTYAAEDLHILLVVESGAGRRDAMKLIGLVQQKGAAIETFEGLPVHLSTTQAAYNQHVDELGNFVFAPVAPAVYTLELQLPESVVVIDHLEVTMQA